jgi:hypothetical protein
LLQFCFCCRRFELQLFEQQVTSSQHRSHFLRHVKGRPHTTQILEGKLALAIGLLVFSERILLFFPEERLAIPRISNEDTLRAQLGLTNGEVLLQQLC